MRPSVRKSFVCFAFAALVSGTAAGVSITIVSPTASLVGDPLSVSTTVTSTGAVQSVVATIGSVSRPLQFDAFNGGGCNNIHGGCPGWAASLDLATLPRGPYLLQVHATDSLGGAADASVQVVLDRGPFVTLAVPARNFVVQGPTRVRATCSDDEAAGCQSLKVDAFFLGAGTTVPSSDAANIDAILAPPDGATSWTIVATGIGASGQVRAASALGVFETSPYFVKRAQVPGTIVAADAGRVLYADRFNFLGDMTRLRMRDLASGTEAVVFDSATLGIGRAWMTPSGAVLEAFSRAQPNPGQRSVLSWENGALVDLGPSVTTLVEGAYVAWMASAAPAGIQRRDTLAGVQASTAPSSALTYGLASDGSLAYTGIDGNVYLVPPNGTLQQVTFDGSDTLVNSAPVTDGASVAFTKCTAGGSCEIDLFRNGATQVLGTSPFSGDLFIRNGWLAFSKTTAGSSGPQVFRMAPDGTQAQLTAAAGSAAANAIAGDGTVIHSVATIVRPDGSTTGQIPTSGTLYFSQDTAYVRSADTLFEVVMQGVVQSATSLQFGYAPMGTTTAPLSFTLTNHGAAAASLAFAVDPPFIVGPGCATIAPLATCTVDVYFAPVPDGSPIGTQLVVNGTLTVSVAGAAQPATVQLAGVAEHSFARFYYVNMLHRQPDPPGLAFWQGEAVRMGALGGNLNEAWFSMAQYFFNSAEYQNAGRSDDAFLRDMYLTFLGREPDAPGVLYWTGQMASGLPREAVMLSFMFSPEFAALAARAFPGSSARAEVDVVTDFYRGALGRLPDSAGFDYWVGQFREAQCRPAFAVVGAASAISQSFFDSAEYVGRNRSNVQYVDDLYDAFMRRGADLDGAQHWVQQLQASGLTRDQLRASFLGSAEFTSRVQGVIAQGCIPR